MAKFKLTDRKIATLKPSEKEQNIGDGDGLWLRIQPDQKGGAKSWYLRYRFGGKAKRLTFGKYPRISLAEARKLSEKAHKQLAQNRDPNLTLGVSPKAHTVRELFELWSDKILVNHADQGAKIRNHLEYDVFPSIGDRPVTTVTHQQIEDLVEKIVDRGAKTKASKVLSYVKQLFAFGVRRRWLTADPAAGIRARDLGAGEQSRSRNLSWDELAQLSQQMKVAHLPKHIEASLWILLLTGVRGIELRQAQKEHINVDKKIWYIPATKNNLEHLVHLSDFALKWFKTLLVNQSDTWLLHGTKIKDPINESVLRKVIGERIGTVNRTNATAYHGALSLVGGDWSLHDLRRTMASRMGDLGVSPHIIELCLNHKVPGIAGVYQRQLYLDERRDAFDRWGAELHRIYTMHNQ